MSSLNQLVSEMAHSVQQADSVPVRRALRLGIIHARNELIRKDNNNNRSSDRILQQRFKISLIDVPDGDLVNTDNLPIVKIKRSATKVPRAVRLSSGVPFHSVRTAGMNTTKEIAFIRESAARHYKHLPGMCNVSNYDLINEYLYVNVLNDNELLRVKYLIVESIFEYPHLIQTETSEGVLNLADVDDDDEFLLPEDMIGSIKKIVLETFNPQVVRQTNEVPTVNLVK